MFVECHGAQLGSFVFELYLPSLGLGLFLVFHEIRIMLSGDVGVSESPSLTRGQCLDLASSGLRPSLDALLSIRGSRIRGIGRRWLRLGLDLIVGPLAPTPFFP